MSYGPLVWAMLQPPKTRLHEAPPPAYGLVLPHRSVKLEVTGPERRIGDAPADVRVTEVGAGGDRRERRGVLAGEGQVARVAGADPGVVADDGIGADAGLHQADAAEVADPLVPVVLVRAAVQRLGAARGGLARRQRDGDEATRASGAVAHVLGDDIAQVIGPDGPLPGEMARREAGRVEGEGRGGRHDRPTRAGAVEVVEHAAELVGAPGRVAERELVVAALRADRRGAGGELVVLAVAGQAELDARAVPRQRAVERALSDAELVAARGVRRRDVRVPVVTDGRGVVVRVSRAGRPSTCWCRR